MRPERRRRGPVRTLLALLTTTVAAGALVAPGSPATSAPRPDRPAAPAKTFENPLAPRIPGGGTVDSCADPTVLRGQERGDRSWYLYCTTDPLNDADLDADGNLRFHPLPMLRSRNLVDWRYVGDALPEPPSWAAEGAGIWAPDVVHSKATGRYYLTFVVTDTDDELRGDGACASTSDSALGVAVGGSPTGPWTIQDTPLVLPRPDPDTPCGFFWTYDPDVLGDSVGRGSVLYYGSYYGGQHATRIRFDATQVRAVGAPTPIGIGNRYEGANVVKRAGWYWLFGSATNCCNGPLTSYGVFAARSRSPLGPFRDRTGASVLEGRVGGTPFLLPNGNRWVGVGHNSVFTDAAGRWWTAYHAVDVRDPYFATDPGFTKRPALLDRVTWRDGWPEVRDGLGASARPVARPAVRPGSPDRYRRQQVPPLRLGARLPAYSDSFGSRRLDPAWRWRRPPADGDATVGQGRLRLRTQAGDLARESNDAPVLLRRGPRGDYVVQTRVRLDLPPEGCCQNFVQAGIVLDAGDDQYLKLAHASLWETRQTEFAKEVPTAPAEYPRYGNGVVGPPGDTTWLRIAVETRPGQDRYTAYTSDDGRRWVRGGTWRHELGPHPRIGLVAMGGEGFTAQFLDVTTWRLRR